MLKRGYILTALASTLIVVFTFCDKKNNPAPAEPETKKQSAETSSVAPTPTSTTNENLLGLTLNPLGSESPLATASSSLFVSKSLLDWVFDPCLLNPLTLKGTKGTTVVLLTFGSNITSGNFTLTSGIPLPGQVRMTVLNPPGQPTGLLWVSKSGGTVSVNVGTSTTIAAFTGVQCTQPLFPYPIVTVSGDVGCN